MTHWKLTIAYDGTRFRGWQVQPSLPTVQGLLADAIFRTVGERVLPQGSGRTDAGVHALGQVASFTLAASIPASNLHNALNRCLPPSIRILCAEIVSSCFHARHSALRKTYEYRIFPLKSRPDSICPPILAPYVWPCPWPLDLATLNQAAAHVLGTHDFTSFAASDPDLTTRKDAGRVPTLPAAKPGLRPVKSLRSDDVTGSKDAGKGRIGVEKRSELRFFSETSDLPETSLAAGSVASNSGPSAETLALHTNLRTVLHSSWDTRDGLLIYQVTATGFLHHMVRNLVGTFVQCGAHRLSPDSIPGLLAARHRSAAGPTAPPTGLFLLNVEYQGCEPSTPISGLEPGR